MNNRFILGIGSQRAGSTLLHHLLNESTDIFMHPIKELHYFDTLYGYRAKAALKDFSLGQISLEIDRILNSQNIDYMGKRYRNKLRTAKILATVDIKKIDYIDLYRPFLMSNNLLGEVTPEYMLLSEKDIGKMVKVIGKDAGIILLCRHPVDRLVSAVKLMNVYNSLNMNSKQSNEWLTDQINTDSGWIKCQDSYNDYNNAIKLYSSIFENFIAVGYEDLINKPKSVAKAISDKLKIRVEYNIFEKEAENKKNSLDVEFLLSPENEKILNTRYAEQISFYKSKFNT